MAGRDKDATWRTLGTLCRELGWSRPRLFYELQNGLRTRTFPPGHVFNWHDPSLRRVLDVEASTLPLSYANASGMATVNSSLTMQEPIGIEALPPDEALPPPADASAQWARATTRRLRDENRPPEDAKKKQSELARLLAAEAQTAVKAGQLNHALKASYLENQLIPWGIWPLKSFK